jgi:subtilisin family serine protease
VAAVWGIPELIFQGYVSTMLGIEYAALAVEGLDLGVANLSIGPPASLLPMPFDPDEPMNAMTRFAASRNQVLVFAAGNAGPTADTLNPWCVAPWVLCVGASSHDGKLADFSARGRSGDTTYRPTVVAPGVDIVTTHPSRIPKTREQMSDEERVGLRQRLPPAMWDQYTVVSGTSFAAPEVTRVVAQIVHFLSGLERDLAGRHGGTLPPSPTFSQVYEDRPDTAPDDRVTTHRLIGEWRIVEKGVAVGTYPLEPSPALVKQLILDMALPMNGYDSSAVGAGFVSRELAMKYFGSYGEVDPRLIPVRVQ